jgi:hypothetical protein
MKSQQQQQRQQDYYWMLLATSGMLTAIGAPATATPATARRCRSGGLKNVIFLLTNKMKMKN